MKHEYHEGPEAKERFDELVKNLFQTPRSIRYNLNSDTPLRPFGLTEAKR